MTMTAWLAVGQVAGLLAALAGVYLLLGLPATVLIAGLLLLTGCVFAELGVRRERRED